MLKLSPVLKDYIWGGYRMKPLFGRDNKGKKISESWEVSVHPDGMSSCGGQTLKEYLDKNPHAVGTQGGELPVLIKYIDAADKLSVQVHPNDAYARRHEHDNGKTEMWYIVRAEAGAGIYCGFKRDVTKEEFLDALQGGRVEELLNFIPVKAGDCYLIEAGTVHAIGAGCLILEVQQSSNVTYRAYDYNRRDANGNLRPLHLEKALDVMGFHAYRDGTGSGDHKDVSGGKLRLLTSCNYFRCRELKLDGAFTEKNDSSFTAVNVLDGEGEIGGVRFAAGDSFFIPCGEEFEIKGSGTMILTNGVPKYYAGIDLGGTFIKCGIVDGDGNILASEKIETGRERPYEEIAHDMAALVRRLEEGTRVRVSAVGVGSPGTVDSQNGVIVYSNNIRWKDVPLRTSLEALLKVPVYITNDANAAALGEYAFGAGSAFESVVLITLGTGVGGGIVLDGKLFEGNRSAGAEIGHTVIRMGGEKCTCGRRGCFEAYASATALIRQTKKAMIVSPDSRLWELCQGNAEKVDGKTAFDGMRLGDRAATRVVKNYIRYLAEGIANLCNEFRPEAVLLGGGVCAEGETLLKPLKKQVEKLLYGGTEYAPVEILRATLGNDAGLVGAAKYAMR